MVTTTQRNHGLSANGLERIGADANWCLLCVKVCVSDMCLPCKTRPAPVRTHLVLHATERAVDARHGPPSEPRSTSPCGHHHIVASRVGGGRKKGENERRRAPNPQSRIEFGVSSSPDPVVAYSHDAHRQAKAIKVCDTR